MVELNRNSLWSLEQYAEQRPEFRAKVMEHKKNRNVALNEHARLYFEDEMTIRYQVQEMLRIEKLFEADDIQQELDAYNPLIPNGSNWKATFMLEYDDEQERRQMLTKLIGIEQKVWMQIDGFERVYPIADEDLDRADAERTSTVHFLRYELTADMVGAVKAGKAISAGIDHPNYSLPGKPIDNAVRESLANDLD